VKKYKDRQSIKILDLMLVSIFFLSACGAQAEENEKGTLPAAIVIQHTSESSSVGKIATTANQNLNEIHQWIVPAPFLYGLIWDPNSDGFFVASPKSVEFYDLKTYTTRWIKESISPGNPYSGMGLSSDGKFLYLYNPLNGVIVVNGVSGEILTEKAPNEVNIDGDCLMVDASGSVLSRDGRKLILDMEGIGPKNSVPRYSELNIWDTQELRCLEKIDSVEGDPVSVDTSPDGKYLSWNVSTKLIENSGGLHVEGNIILWDLETRHQTCVIKGTANAFSPEKNLLIVFDQVSGEIAYWDYTTCHKIQDLTPAENIYRLSISHNGKWLGIIESRHIIIMGAKDGNILTQLEYPVNLHEATLMSSNFLIFSPNDQYLLLGVPDGPQSRIVLWEFH